MYFIEAIVYPVSDVFALTNLSFRFIRAFSVQCTGYTRSKSLGRSFYSFAFTFISLLTSPSSSFLLASLPSHVCHFSVVPFGYFYSPTLLYVPLAHLVFSNLVFALHLLCNMLCAYIFLSLDSFILY